MSRLLPIGVLLLVCASAFAQQRFDVDGDPLPEGAFTRLGSQRFRPPQPWPWHHDIRVVITPDGKHLATGEERGIRFWDIDTGRESGFISLPNGRVDFLRFDPDGKRFIAITDDGPPIGPGSPHHTTLYVGDVKQRKATWHLTTDPGKDPGFKTAAFAANGSVIVAQTYSERNEPGQVRFFKVQNGDDQGVAELNCSAVSPDGFTLVGGTTAGEMVLLDIATRKELKKWQALDGPIDCVAWSPDGKRIASAGGRIIVDGKYQGDWRNHVWDAATGKQLFEVKMTPGMSEHLAFSPDAKLLYSYGLVTCEGVARDRQMRVWEIGEHTEIWRDNDIPKLTPKTATIANGTRLSFEVREEPNGLLIRAEASGKEVWRWWACPGWSNSAMSPDGRWLASAGRQLRVIDLQTGKDRADHGGHRTPINELRFTPDGSTLLSMDENQYARLWKPTGSRLRFPGDDKSSWCTVKSLNSGAFLFVGEDGTVRVWDAVANRLVRELPIKAAVTTWSSRVLGFDIRD